MTENLPMEHQERISSLMDVNLDTDVKICLLEKFPSLAKDETARISLIAFDLESKKFSPLLKFSQYYFVELSETNKLSFAAPDAETSKDMLARVVKEFGEPKIRFGTIILRYHTDKNGVILKNADGNISYTFYAWLIGTDKWTTLRGLHQEWNLFGRDLLVKWDAKSDIKFQNLTIQPAQDCYWKHLPEANDLISQGRALYSSSLSRYLARVYDDKELAIKLGWEIPPVAANAANPFLAGPQAQITQQAGVTSEAVSPFSKIVKPAAE